VNKFKSTLPPTFLASALWRRDCHRPKRLHFRCALPESQSSVIFQRRSQRRETEYYFEKRLCLIRSSWASRHHCTSLN